MGLKDDIRKLVESRKSELTGDDREMPAGLATTAAKLEELRPYLKDFEEVGASCYVSEGGLFAQVDVAGLYVTIHPPGKSLGIEYSGWYVTAINAYDDFPREFADIESMIEYLTPIIADAIARSELGR